MTKKINNGKGVNLFYSGLYLLQLHEFHNKMHDEVPFGTALVIVNPGNQERTKKTPTTMGRRNVFELFLTMKLNVSK